MKILVLDPLRLRALALASLASLSLVAASGCSLVDAFSSEPIDASSQPGDSDTDDPDGSSDPRFGCADDPPPTTAPASITIAGDIRSPFGHLESGILVELRRRSNEAVLGSNTTSASGMFSITASTGGAPLDAYLRLTRGDLATGRAYTSGPVAADLDVNEAVMYTPQDMQDLATIGSTTYNTANGIVAVLVVDCLGAPITGAVVTMTPAPATLRYVDNNGPKAGLTSTTSNGAAIGFNVPPGNVMVEAMAAGRRYRTVPMRSFAGELAGAEIPP